MIKRTVASALLSVSVLGQAQNISQQDSSINIAVAVFVASNMKLAVDNALRSMIATGIDCDTAIVRRLVFEQLALPYDADAYHKATATIDLAMSAKAISESQNFLREAANANGAVLLPDGLVIEILQEGEGDFPSPESTITMRYKGSLPDGTVFDHIHDNEAPMQTPVGELAPGMAEALLHMKAGGTYRITIPPELAYGHDGVPGVIPPDCAIRFDVKLIEIK